MHKIAAIGDESSVLLFKAVGATIYDVNNDLEAEAAIKEVASKNYSLVFITEYFQNAVSPILEDKPALNYLFIPPIRGATGEAAKTFEDTIQKAVGAKY